MFIHHAHLYCIECKTAKTMAHEQAKDVLYKLSSFAIFWWNQPKTSGYFAV